MATFQITLDDQKMQDAQHEGALLPVLIETVLNQVLQAEMTEHLRASPGERSGERRGYRNGSYSRQLTTRVGTIELEVPRDRAGTFQTELFERYQRSDGDDASPKALVLSLLDMVVQGVSTRKVKKITDTLCGRRFARSTVSDLAKRLDEQVAAWAERPLDAHRYPFVLVDALYVRVRRHGAVRSTAALLAVGINEEGQREILGLDVACGETRETWQDFFQSLRARGLRGVDYVTSDAHEGLRQALERTFPGVVWQRCQAHFMRNVLGKTPPSCQEAMHTHLCRILHADTPQAARAALEEAQSALEGQADRALECLTEGFEAATAVLALPTKYRKRLRTTNMLERFIEEIRRREKVVRIFPNESSAWRLIGALAAEQHEAWLTGRRYLTMDAYEAWRACHGAPAQHASAT
jgi:transposase-like protein